MYQYKFVEIRAKLLITFHFKGFQELIEEHALEGWRFVTAIPVESQGAGSISVLSLVFEKNMNE